MFTAQTQVSSRQSGSFSQWPQLSSGRGRALTCNGDPGCLLLAEQGVSDDTGDPIPRAAFQDHRRCDCIQTLSICSLRRCHGGQALSRVTSPLYVGLRIPACRRALHTDPSILIALHVNVKIRAQGWGRKREPESWGGLCIGEDPSGMGYTILDHTGRVH